jgi:hypothetical protein
MTVYSGKVASSGLIPSRNFLTAAGCWVHAPDPVETGLLSKLIPVGLAQPQPMPAVDRVLICRNYQRKPAADGLLIYYLMPTQTITRALESMGSSADQLPEQIDKLTEDVCNSVLKLRQNQSKPFIGYSFRTRADLFIQKLQDKGMPILPGPERAARAMKALVQYAHLRKKLSQKCI